MPVVPEVIQREFRSYPWWWRLSLTCHACWRLSAVFVSLRETSTAARTPTRLHIIPRYVTEYPDIPPRWIIIISHYSLVLRAAWIRHHDARTTDAVSHHRTNVSNCSALLSRDHTAALAHASTSSRTGRRSFDELTRTVNHGYGGGGEGLASSVTGTAEHARTRPNVHGPARAGAAPVSQSTLRSGPDAPPRYVAFVPLRGVSRDHEKSRNALYTVWHEGYTRYLFALISDREIRRRS